MRKNVILFVFCFLWLCTFGQGTAYVTKTDVKGMPKMIRHWKTGPVLGSHATYFTDAMAGKLGYIGVTEVYNHYYYTQIHDNCIVHDMAVFNDTAYFCGETLTGKVLLGWISLYHIITPPTHLNIDTMTFGIVTPTMQSLDNIEVYRDTSGRTRVVGYGTTSTGYIGIEYIIGGSFPLVTYGVLPYTPLDLTLTDDLIVFAGTTGNDIVLHPFKQCLTFDMPYVPYYTYAVSSATEMEPSGNLRVADIGNNHVAVLSYRRGGGVFNMMLRRFNVISVFYGYGLPMLTAFRTKFNHLSPFGCIYDFTYDANKSAYLVFQNYEVTSSDYHDAVTKINVSGGVPSTVQSDYLAMTDHPMKSMSLSDASTYVVYGYKAAGFDQVFWKDSTSVTVSGMCLNADILPTFAYPLTPEVRHDYYYGTPFSSGSPVRTKNTISIYKAIVTSCH